MTDNLTNEEPDLSEQDILFNAWLDNELDPQELLAFQQRLDTDPDFKRAHQQFVSVMQVVRKIPFEFAPDDFVDNIQGYIRQRSRGRFFTENNFLTQPRMPYEVVAVVMMLVMAAVYILMEAPHDTDVKPVPTPHVQQPQDTTAADREP